MKHLVRRASAGVVLLVLGVGLACGSSSPSPTPIECCPRGGGASAGGGSKRLHGGTCLMAYDCLRITGVAKDADGCEYDVWESVSPCGMVVDAGVDATSDASADAPFDVAAE